MLLVAMPDEDTAGGTVLTSDSVQRRPRRRPSMASGPSMAVPVPGWTMARLAPKASAVAKSAAAAARWRRCARKARGKVCAKNCPGPGKRSPRSQFSQCVPCRASARRRRIAPVSGKREAASAWSWRTCR